MSKFLNYYFVPYIIKDDIERRIVSTLSSDPIIALKYIDKTADSTWYNPNVKLLSKGLKSEFIEKAQFFYEKELLDKSPEELLQESDFDYLVTIVARLTLVELQRRIETEAEILLEKLEEDLPKEYQKYFGDLTTDLMREYKTYMEVLYTLFEDLHKSVELEKRNNLKFCFVNGFLYSLKKYAKNF